MILTSNPLSDQFTDFDYFLPTYLVVFSLATDYYKIHNPENILT